MELKTSHFFTFLFCLAFIAFASSVPAPNEISRVSLNGTNATLEHLLTVGNKSYYTAGVANMTWLEARALCDASNLTLATVTSYNEHQQLKRAIPQGQGIRYWTAGREKRSTWEMIVWDTNENEPNNTFFDASSFERREDPYNFCVTFWTYMFWEGSVHLVFSIDPCEQNYRVLCEGLVAASS